MTRPVRRRGHAAASARILSAGLSSAAAFGMVAGMAVTAGGADNGQAESAGVWAAEPGATTAGPSGDPAVAAAPSEVVVVIRRHWVPAPELREGTTPGASAPAPLLTTAPARPATVAAPAPARTVAPRPITRTRGS